MRLAVMIGVDEGFVTDDDRRSNPAPGCIEGPPRAVSPAGPGECAAG
jgi:hypothetical protein